MRARVLEWREGPVDPEAIWRALGRRPSAGRVALESLAPGPGTGRWSIFAAEPQGRVRWREDALVVERTGQVVRTFPTRPGAPFDALREVLAWFRGPGDPAADPRVPFVAGAIGWVSYEMGRRLEPRSFPGVRPDLDPPLELGLYGGAIVVDGETGATLLAAADTTLGTADETVGFLEGALRAAPRASAAVPSAPADPATDADAGGAAGATARAHAAAVARIRALIEAGDLYQANLSVRFRRPTGLALDTLWERLRAGSPEPFAACLEGADRGVLCASMERFLSVRGETVETRPIKGTRPRDPDPARDASARDELAASEKDRAELLMIVDLHRNDLGRVCVPGSVRVPTLFGVRTFARVHHLEATVQGRIAPGRDAFDLLGACFPAGSITGAPKIRAMQVLEEVEPEPRGVYCGAVGWIGVDGNADFAVAIRTAVLHEGVLRWSAGGGIVWDSEPDAEWREVLAKAAGFEALLAGAPPVSASG